MAVVVRETAKVWNPAARETDELKLPPNEACAPFESAQCIVPRFWNGFWPRISMMSISPQEGHPTVLIEEPSIQNAGQMPCPWGTWIRASTQVLTPKVRRPCVLRRADVVFVRPRVFLGGLGTEIPFCLRAVCRRIL